MRFAAIILGFSLTVVSVDYLSAHEHSTRQKDIENINLVSSLFDGELSEEKIEGYNEILADDVILHGPAMGQVTKGISNLKKLEYQLSRGLENICIIIDEIFSHKDKVVVFWTVQAEKGDKNISVTGHGIYRVTEGKINEIWQSWDTVSDPFIILY
jgi:hypothetical protein